MQVSFFDTGGFVAHAIRHSDKFYSAWFDAEGKMLDITQTGRWGYQPGGFKIRTHVRFENDRAVPDRCIHIRAAIQGVGRGIHRNRAAYGGTALVQAND